MSKNIKKCHMPNYLPHSCMKNIDRERWHNNYIQQIIDIHSILYETINQKYPKNKIDWKNNDKIVHNLSRVLYHSSSKYLSPYLKDSYD
jgi:hypothetical protein